MLSRIRTRLAPERGVAMVTAMLLSMVVLTLGATSVTIAMHNSEQSSNDRRRVQAIAAAEAGINYYFSHLQSVAPGAVECSLSKNLTGSPVTSFSASVSFVDSTGSPTSCPPPFGESLSAVIESTGTVAGAAYPARTMQAMVNLMPSAGGGGIGDGAVFSDGGPVFNSTVHIAGNVAYDGDVYSNGSVSVNHDVQVEGSIVAQGSVKLNAYGDVKNHVMAGTWIEINNHSNVYGNATASASYLKMSNASHIWGDGRAGTTITVTGSEIHGLTIGSSPSPAPPTRAFPTYTYDSVAWTDAGYTISTFNSCAEAEAFIDGISDTSKRLVRITSVCVLEFNGGGDSPSVRGDLAIVSNGSLKLNSGAGFNNVGAPHNLHLFFGHGQPVSSCDPGKIELNSRSYIAAGLTALLHTPCKIKVNSDSMVVQGQIFGGSVEFNAQSGLNYKPVPVPGYGEAGLWDEDIVYIREVRDGSG